jgi:amino acid adenylation domain-containing protein
VLLAGGAYVPLSPGYPAERLAWLLEDTGAPVVLTREEDRAALDESVRRLPRPPRVAGLDEALEAPVGELGVVADGGSLAYVLYTSGSTGRPKGVAVPHRAITRLVLSTDYVHLEPRLRVAQASNPAFDAATFEIWGALLNGARLVEIPREVALTPAALAAELRARRIDVLFLTTALFNQIAAEAPEAFASLESLLFGGEAVDPGSVRRVLERGAPRRLLHVYGPTETTTFASWHLVREVAAGAVTVPIGRPIANTSLQLLDRALRPVPLGVVGEVFLGGDGLALGYLGHPELTAERFVPHPQPGGPGERLYRTGDLARRRGDGAVEYVGRLDHQVKIRGFRIEPGEIEAALAEHPGLSEALVLAVESGRGGGVDRRLVAYVVPADGSAPSAGELRSHLERRLPAYMVPSVFVSLAAFPLNSNGKVDRRALPAPDGSRPELVAQFEPPRTPLEREIAEIWAAVLGCREVGIRDDFFALGGHSLLATRLLGRYQEAFGVTLPLRALFEAPTVAELAEVVATVRRQQPAGPAIRRISRESYRVKLT